MKKQHVLLMALILFITSCAGDKDRYIDLRSGQHIAVEKDSQGIWVDANTKKPVYIYVDTKKHDTIYGKTGEVINGHVIRGNDNDYWYDVDVTNNETEKGDYKKKVEEDGDIKIKSDNGKTKIDGETGEKKVKK